MIESQPTEPDLQGIVSAEAEIKAQVSAGQVTIAAASLVSDALAKHAAVSVGSFYENLVCWSLLQLYSDVNDARRRFVWRGAIDRKFMTMFDFEGTNINRFLSLFGEDAKAELASAIKDDADLAAGVRAFLGLCQDRNLLVHNNLFHFSFSKTVTEVVEAFEVSRSFMTWLSTALLAACSTPATA